MKEALVRLCDSEDGVTSIEYALLASLIAVVIVVSVGTVGIAVARLFDDVKDKLILVSK